MAELDPDSFDPTQPALFYCKHEDLAAMADAAVVVEGVELPVHKAVLTLHSSVFRAAYSTGEQTAPATRANKRCKVTTTSGFEGFSVRDAALFLRLVYDPTAITPANMARLWGSLPALARLAHKFDVQPLLAAIEQQLLQPADAGSASSSSSSGSSNSSGGSGNGDASSSGSALLEVAERLQLAEELHMDRLLVAGVRQAARLLVRRLPSSKVDIANVYGIAAAVQLPDLGPRATRLLLGALLASAASEGRHYVVDKPARSLPSPEIVAGWAAQELGSYGQLTWEVPLNDFLSAHLSAREALTSPQFTAGGLTWQVAMYPEGRDLGAAGYISMYLCLAGTGNRPAQANVRVAASLELLSTVPTCSVCAPVEAVFKGVGSRVGHLKFVNAITVLGPDSSFLHKGKLVIKACVVV